MNAKKTLPTAPPQRTDTHRTDTDAVRILRTKLTSNWVERNVEDRDYGIDLMMENFDNDRPTGGLVLLQVKGKEASFAHPVQLQFPVKTLLYAEMFATPFFLCHVSLSDQEVYYVWLQKYIKTRLLLDSPDWKTQDKVNINFPEENVLNEAGLDRIARLARYTVHRDLGFTFLYHSSWVFRHMHEVRRGNFDAVEGVVENLKKLGELDAFMEQYSEFAEDLNLSQFIRILEKAQQYKSFDYGDEESIDTQLGELVTIQELFLSADDRDAFIVENSTGDHPY